MAPERPSFRVSLGVALAGLGSAHSAYTFDGFIF